MTTKSKTTKLVKNANASNSRYPFPNNHLAIGTLERVTVLDKVAFITLRSSTFLDFKVFNTVFDLNELAKMLDGRRGELVAIKYGYGFESILESQMTPAQKALADAGKKLTREFRRVDEVSLEISVDDKGWTVDGTEFIPHSE